jgi:integrative and conjugative element protein (TIGR02256 family)
MAAWRVLSALWAKSVADWQGNFHESRQSVRIQASVLHILRKYRQVRAGTPESGGQLFGTVTGDLVAVCQASRPSFTDDKQKSTFRSDPDRAQAAIRRFARKRLLYLGEWHTHAEAMPKASSADEDAMHNIFLRSSLNTSALLLLIIGYAQPDDDVGVWYIDALGTLRRVDRAPRPNKHVKTND